MPLVIEDNVTGYLKQLGIVAPNYINEGLSKGAYIVYKAIQDKASTYSDDDFSQFHDNGKRGIAGRGAYSKLNRRNAVLTKFGKPFERTSRTSANSPAPGAKNMAELTRWRVYYGKMKAVVGWMNTKSFAPLKIEKGVIKGHMGVVKGTSLYDKKDISKKHNIAELMEYGGEVKLSDAQKKLFMVSGMAKVARRGYVIRKARPLIAPAFANSRGEAEDKMLEIIKEIVNYDAKNSTTIRRAS